MRPTIAASGAENVVYIWEQPDWPKLTWQDGSIAALLAAVRHEQGRLIGRMEALGFSLQNRLFAQTEAQRLHTADQSPLLVTDGSKERGNAAILPGQPWPVLLLPDVHHILRITCGDCCPNSPQAQVKTPQDMRRMMGLFSAFPLCPDQLVHLRL